jgi:hypothetical protein
MNYLSALAIFRQEDPWLNEWLNYHIHVGIEHFYLLNHDIDAGDPGCKSDAILKPYVEKGLVTNIPVLKQRLLISTQLVNATFAVIGVMRRKHCTARH